MTFYQVVYSNTRQKVIRLPGTAKAGNSVEGLICHFFDMPIMWMAEEFSKH